MSARVKIAVALAGGAWTGMLMASPQKVSAWRLPSVEGLVKAECVAGSWTGQGAPTLGFSQWILNLPMVRALGPLREKTPFTFVRFVDSEVAEKYAETRWALMSQAVVCGVAWSRDEFLREVSGAVETNGLVRLENEQGKVGLNEYWYVAFSSDGRWAALGESPEMARMALEEKPDESVRDACVRGTVYSDGLKVMASRSSVFKGLVKLSELNLDLWLEPDGLRVHGNGMLRSTAESSKDECLPLGTDALSEASRRSLYAVAMTGDERTDFFDFYDGDALLAVLREGGVDVSSVRPSISSNGNCTISLGLPFVRDYLEKTWGLFGAEPDADLVRKLQGLTRSRRELGVLTNVVCSVVIEGCEPVGAPSERFAALLPHKPPKQWKAVAFVDLYRLMKAVLCERVSIEEPNVRTILQPLLAQLPESGDGVAWRVGRRGENVEAEAKIAVSEIRGLISLWKIYCALMVQRAENRAWQENRRKNESPVEEAGRQVSLGNLTDAMKILECAPTNNWRICYEVGDFYGSHTALPTQRAERVQCWMDRAYRLADETGKRQVAVRCAKGFYFRDYECFNDDLARLWLQRAADAGSAYWQCVIADAFVYAYRGFPKDGQMALYYLELAEKSKHLKTHHVRASMYKLGVGLPKDSQKALECLELGVRRGSDVCRRDLAIMLLDGCGGEGRRAEGFAMLQRLLAKGVESPGYCLSKLGYACERGHGVKKDLQRAIEFYRQAAALNDRYSIKRLKELKAD